MSPDLIAHDIIWIAVLVLFYAFGHFQGWTDCARAVKRTGRAPSVRPASRGRFLLRGALIALVVFGLLLRWAGVLA